MTWNLYSSIFGGDSDRERFESRSDTARRSQLDYMQVISIDGGLEPQPNKPGAKTSCVFKTYSSYSSASVILECESSPFVKNHCRPSKGVLIYISSPPIMDFTPPPPTTGIITLLFWPPVLAPITISFLLQTRQIGVWWSLGRIKFPVVFPCPLLNKQEEVTEKSRGPEWLWATHIICWWMTDLFGQ